MKKIIISVFIGILFIGCVTPTTKKVSNTNKNTVSIETLLNNFMEIRKNTIQKISKWNGEEFSFESFNWTTVTYTEINSGIINRREDQLNNLFHTLNNKKLSKVKNYLTQISVLRTQYEKLKIENNLSTHEVGLVNKNLTSIEQLTLLTQNYINHFEKIGFKIQ